MLDDPSVDHLIRALQERQGNRQGEGLASPHVESPLGIADNPLRAAD